MHYLWLGLWLGLFSLFSTVVYASSLQERSTSLQVKKANSIELVIVLNNLRVRAEPNAKAKVISKLLSKDKVIWAGEVSANQDAVTLRAVKFNTPWLKVTTSDGKTGWIYAAAAKTNSADRTTDALHEKFILLRSNSFFGDKLANKMAAYRQAYQQISTDKQFAVAYQQGQTIRDSAVSVLEEKAMADLPNAMDMTWLEDVMPAYSLSLVAEGTQFYLFADFKKMLPVAKASRGSVDEDFLQLASEVYGAEQGEGGEAFFYAWFEQTWDYGGESLLGQGKHLYFVKKMTDFMAKSNLFQAQITQYKNALMSDITQKNDSETQQFRESKAKRAQELEAILQLKSDLLNEKETKLIEQRRKGFS